MNNKRINATAFCCVALTSAFAGGPGSGRHKESFGKGGGLSGGFILLIILILLVMALFGAIGNKMKRAQAKKKFIGQLDESLNKKQLDYNQWSKLKTETESKGVFSASKSLKAEIEKNEKEKALQTFLNDGDELAAKDEINKSEWDQLKSNIDLHRLSFGRNRLNTLIENRKKEKAIQEFKDENSGLVTTGEITELQWNEVLKGLNSIGLEWAKYALDEAQKLTVKQKMLAAKYGEDIGNKIFYKQFFIGMTKEQLKDSAGEPTKIENEVLKTKTKETWIYGNKSSGDVFVFENELLARFKDR